MLSMICQAVSRFHGRLARALQSILGLHCPICLDWRGSRGKFGADARRILGYSHSQRDADEFHRVIDEQCPGRRVKATLDGAQHEFPVLWGDTVMGILTKANLLAGLSEHGPELPVTNAMTREFPMVESTEMLAAALSRLAESKLHTMPVIEDGKMVGL